MTRFVAVGNKVTGVLTNEKYVKQTYEALSHSGLDLEVIARQISQLPVREQRKFFRLLLNYLDITSSLGNYSVASITMGDMVELCKRLMDVVNDYYYEQDEKQMMLDGMQ